MVIYNRSKEQRMEKNMKNTEETLREIERRFVFNQKSMEWWGKQSDMEKEHRHITKAKECESTALEYNSRNYELIMLYSFITGEDWVKVAKHLHNLVNSERNAD